MEALVGSALPAAGAMGPGTVGLFGAGGALNIAGGSAAGFFNKIGGASLLSGLMTGAAAYGHIAAGNSSAALMNLKAQQADLNAQMETIKGREQALSIKTQLNKDLASQNALFSSRGILAGEGSAAAATAVSKRNAEADLNVAQFGADMGSQSDRLRAAQYRIEGKTAKRSGKTEALNVLANSRVLQNAGSTLLSGL